MLSKKFEKYRLGNFVLTDKHKFAMERLRIIRNNLLNKYYRQLNQQLIQDYSTLQIGGTKEVSNEDIRTVRTALMNSNNIPDSLVKSDDKINTLFTNIKSQLVNLGKEKEANILDGLKNADKELNTSFGSFADQMEQVDKDSPIRGQLVELQKAFYQLQLKIIFSEIKKIKSVDVNPLIMAITNKVNAMNKFIDQQSDTEIKAQLQNNSTSKDYDKLQLSLQPLWEQIKKGSYGGIIEKESKTRVTFMRKISEFIREGTNISDNGLENCGELCDIYSKVKYYIYGNKKENVTQVANTISFNVVFDKIKGILEEFYKAVGNKSLTQALNVSNDNKITNKGSQNSDYQNTDSLDIETLHKASRTDQSNLAAEQERNAKTQADAVALRQTQAAAVALRQTQAAEAAQAVKDVQAKAERERIQAERERIQAKAERERIEQERINLQTQKYNTPATPVAAAPQNSPQSVNNKAPTKDVFDNIKRLIGAKKVPAITALLTENNIPITTANVTFDKNMFDSFFQNIADKSNFNSLLTNPVNTDGLTTALKKLLK